MAARGVRRAPVVDDEGRLTGVVSVDDVVPLLAQEMARIGVLIRRAHAEEIIKTDSSVQDE
jgi:CBS domain-containing protein